MIPKPIGSMYGIYANIGGILMVNVTIYGIHGSYGKYINDTSPTSLFWDYVCMFRFFYWIYLAV